MERLGEPSVRENYTLLKGALLSLPLDSTRHAYLMSNLDRLYEAYLRAWETLSHSVDPAEDNFGLVKKRAGASTVSLKSLSGSSGVASGASSSRDDKETKQE